jgi:uncharacterized protein YndB with AHSA1/START domain
MTKAERIIQPAPVRRSIDVAVSQARAFEVFTSGMSRWWPREKSIGASPQVRVVMEPLAGGRWYEVGEDGSQCQWGKVLAWEPPGRLLLAWQIGADWRFDPDLQTEVEVLFTALGPKQTRVELEHRKLEAYGDKAELMRERFEAPAAWGAVLEIFAAGVEL